MNAQVQLLNVPHHVTRTASVAKIQCRPLISIRTVAGIYKGVPVMEDEWVSLPSGTRVVLVESYSSSQDNVTLETFIVAKKTGGHPQKYKRVYAYARQPVTFNIR